MVIHMVVIEAYMVAIYRLHVSANQWIDMADLAIRQVWASRVFDQDFVDIGKYSIPLACSTC